MKKTFKISVSLLLAFIMLFSLSVTAFAADTAQSGNFIQQILIFLLGENAFVDGSFNIGSIFHALFYKDTPAMYAILDPIYEGFWDFIISIINLFVK